MTQNQPKLPIAATSLLAITSALFLANWTQADFPGPGDQEQAGEPRLAQSEVEPTAATKNNPRLAKATLRKARENLRQHQSIQADIAETIVIGNRKFKASGSYLQGTEMRLRLEYQIQVGTEVGSLTEVSDGQVLWTQHIIGKNESEESEGAEETAVVEEAVEQQDDSSDPNSPTELDPLGNPTDESESKKPDDNIRVTRRDIDKIRKAAAENQNVPDRVLTVELGLGGLPALMASLEEAMQFTTVKEERIDGQTFTVVEGGWTVESLRQFGAVNTTQRLPDHIPDKVRLYFDRDTLFPRRILYLKRHPVRDFPRPMLTLDFVNVLLDAPVDELAFHFEPPEGIVPNDITELYLKQLAAGARRFDTPTEGDAPAAGEATFESEPPPPDAESTADGPGSEG